MGLHEQNREKKAQGQLPLECVWYSSKGVLSSDELGREPSSVSTWHETTILSMERTSGMTAPTNLPPYRTGKICYVEIPAHDVAASAQFYQRVFGWDIRQHADGTTAF